MRILFHKMKILVCLGILSIAIWGMKCDASELQDVNTDRLEHAYGMDENGDFFELDGKAGIVGDEDTSETKKNRAIKVKVVNFNTKGSTEITQYKEYKTNASGYTNGFYGADAAYLGESSGKIKFMLSGVVGLVDAKEVEIVNYEKVKAVSYYVVEDGYLRHRVAHYVNQTSWSSINNGKAPSYLKTGVKYYSYDGHYFYKDYATMIQDYTNENRNNAVNKSDPFYNYYQYLPLRSRTEYTADEIYSLINRKVTETSKLRNKGRYFVQYQNNYGVNALLMTGIAANESAWGNSSICNTKNNLFGINAKDDAPAAEAKVFESIQACVKKFAETYMSRRYLNPEWSYYNGGFLGNKASGINVSYASDPYWGEKAAGIVYTLDMNGGKKDYGRYTIGIKDTIATDHDPSVNIRNEAESNGTKILYKTEKLTSYAVLLRKNEAKNNYYQIQSDGVLNSDRTALNGNSGNYDFKNMYAYISESYVDIVNSGKDISVSSLNAPKNKSAKYSNEAITFEWESVKNAKGYYVYRKVNDGNYSRVANIESADILSYKDTNINKGKKYTYTVRAYNKSVWSKYYTDGVSVTVSEDKITSLNIPELVSAKYTDGTVVFKWEKVANAKGYYIYRKLKGGSYSKIATVKSGATVSYKDSNVKTGKTYVYTVKAYNGDVVSKYNSTGKSVGIPVPKTYTKYKTTTKVNYRSGAGTKYTTKGTLDKGTVVSVEDGYSKKADGYTWVRVKINSNNYYIAKEYLEKVVEKAVTYTKYKTTTRVNYRSGAGTKYTTKGTLDKGTVVSVEDGYSKKVDGYTWVRVKINSNKYYIAKEYLEKVVEKTVTYTKYKATSNLNYRNGAGTSYAIKGTLANGTTVSVEDGYSKEANGYTWVRIKINSASYYVAKKYLEKK